MARGLPSIVKCTTVLGRPVPFSVSFEVMFSLEDAPVMKVRLAVTIGGAVLGSKGAGLSGVVLVAIVEVVTIAEFVVDVATRLVDGIVSADGL